MDGKSRILIVSFLGGIQIASKEKHRKAGRDLWGTLASAFNVVHSAIHRSRPFSVLHKDYRQRTALKGYFLAWIERERS